MSYHDKYLGEFVAISSNIVQDYAVKHLKLADKEIEKLKQQKIEMRTECNRRFSEQLQKIRKLEAEKMLQIQPELFKDGEA